MEALNVFSLGALKYGSFILICLPIFGFSQVNFEKSSDLFQPITNGVVEFEDIDQDGDQDLLIIGVDNQDGRKIFSSFYLNDGFGNFSEKSGTTIPGTRDGAVAFQDIDSDSDMDLIVTGRLNSSSDSVVSQVFENDGLGNFTPLFIPELIPFLRNDIVFEDLNGDGTTDILLIGQGTTQRIQVLSNDGQGNFTEVETDILGLLGASIDAADIDLDGDLDLIAAGSYGGVFTNIYINHGGFQFSVKENNIKDKYSGKLELSDFDNDGDPDLFLSGKDRNNIFSVQLFLNDGNGNFLEIDNPFDSFTSVYDIEFVDIDFDDDDDLLIIGSTGVGPRTFLFMNSGPGQFVRDNLFSPPTNYFGGLASADVNNDGKLDYVNGGLTSNNIDGDVSLFLNKTVNRIPIYSNLVISGESMVGEKLSAVYQFCDADGTPDPQQILWYRNTKPIISGRKSIDVTTSEYILTPEDENYYISFRLNETDGISPEIFTWSPWIGPIKPAIPEIEVYGNSILLLEEANPVQENFTHFGETGPHNGIIRDFIIKNTGKAELVVNEIQISGEFTEDFSLLSSFPFSVPPQEEFPIQIEFNPTGLGERNGQITIMSNDEDENDFQFKISGTGINNPPVFNSPPIVEVSENIEGFVFDIDARNGEGGDEDENLIYSISGGDDQHLFKVDSIHGWLEFIDPPDFEVPLDSDKNNEYLIEIRAYEGMESLVTAMFFITVRNIDESPVIKCLSEFKLVLDATGMAILNIEDVDGGSFDDSEDFQLRLSQTHFTCADVGTKMVYLIGKDSNHESSCTVSLTVIDETPAVIKGISEIVKPNDIGYCYSFVNIEAPLVEDNCVTGALIGTRGDGKSLSEGFPIGETTISWEISGIDQNMVEPFLQVIRIEDLEPPRMQFTEHLLFPSEGSECGFKADIEFPVVTDCSEVESLSYSRSDAKSLEDIFPNGETRIIWTALDRNGNKTEAIQTVEVINKPPRIISISGPESPQEVGESISMTAILEDDNPAVAKWVAFDGNESYEFEQQVLGQEIKMELQELPTGVYSITLELTDHCGYTVSQNYEYVVIYDPSGGFVTGGGWIYSPVGALKNSPASGKANFGFNAKYKNGKNGLSEVGGNTNFQFQAGDLKFKSISHESMSLVVSGGFKATYKGFGSINGIGTYNFLVTVIDAEETSHLDADYFRIKIWNKERVIYDNNPDFSLDNDNPITAIGGGSIVIHKAKGNTKGVLSEKSHQAGNDPVIFIAYPNPMSRSTEIEFQLNITGEVVLAIYDIQGRMVDTLYRGKAEKGKRHKVLLEKGNLMGGIYFYRLTTEMGDNYQKQLLIN